MLLGAGVSVLGPISLGACSKVGAGSVVVQSLPENCVAVGVPARVIKQKTAREPSVDMDQCKGECGGHPVILVIVAGPAAPSCAAPSAPLLPATRH